ncbi:MAG: hypothetical protein Unbinned7358contig1001_27 [Prokaryotic dsDNA virus sp.]|nr:MAG: hypothetical protein Unbinned7358contig1001_27 [Prokaryotic dsDNA virus sp.]|tara:strand:+ start:281 stop:499 length:219 start_codon:yes stop_codon:yes gene_type:complete
MTPYILDGLDDALLGFGSQWSRATLAVYSDRKILEVLQGQGMSYDEAVEFYDFNVRCLWCGEQTPLILEDTV